MATVEEYFASGRLGSFPRTLEKDLLHRFEVVEVVKGAGCRRIGSKTSMFPRSKRLEDERELFEQA